MFAIWFLPKLRLLQRFQFAEERNDAGSDEAIWKHNSVALQYTFTQVQCVLSNQTFAVCAQVNWNDAWAKCFTVGINVWWKNGERVSTFLKRFCCQGVMSVRITSIVYLKLTFRIVYQAWDPVWSKNLLVVLLWIIHPALGPSIFCCLRRSRARWSHPKVKSVLFIYNLIHFAIYTAYHSFSLQIYNLYRGLPWGPLPFGLAWKTSRAKCPGGILLSLQLHTMRLQDGQILQSGA